MAYMKTTTYTSGVNILASEVGLVLKTFEGTQAMATQVDDKKIIKAGTVVFEDVDITDDEKKPISVIIAGRVIKANLPVAVDTNAETALKASGIYFD